VPSGGLAANSLKDLHSGSHTSFRFCCVQWRAAGNMKGTNPRYKQIIFLVVYLTTIDE
jgi:hypothetical protein